MLIQLNQMFLFNQQLIELQTHLGGNLSKEERIEELKKIAKDTVDIRGIGFYSLGSHRKGLSDEKKKNIQKYLKIIL